jgi:hypothetical protein
MMNFIIYAFHIKEDMVGGYVACMGKMKVAY